MPVPEDQRKKLEVAFPASWLQPMTAPEALRSIE
jgi:hypothetical protein